MLPDLIASIAKLLWPTLAIIALYKLWPTIIKITKDVTAVKIKIGDYELSTSKQINEIFIKPLLNELDEAISTLLPSQRELFVIIYNQVYVQGRDYTIPENFVRESDQHGAYRALRNVSFIRPLGGGHWQVGKQVEIKNFGRLAVKLKNKELGFYGSNPA